MKLLILNGVLVQIVFCASGHFSISSYLFCKTAPILMRQNLNQQDNVVFLFQFIITLSWSSQESHVGENL